jgi:hypothetical protein
MSVGGCEYAEWSLREGSRGKETIGVPKSMSNLFRDLLQDNQVHKGCQRLPSFSLAVVGEAVP